MAQATHLTNRGSNPAAAKPPRWSLRRALQAAAALGLVVFAGGLATTGAGCGNSTETAQFCVGGFVRKDPKNPTAQGTCEGKCDPTKCAADNTCVDNKCTLNCTSNLDCTPLTQDCVPAVDDESKKAINVCHDNGKGPIGQKCPFGTECAMATSCPDGTACDPACTGASCACAAADCKPLVCRTAGTGDADAFCTLKDCHADADCPGGFWCEAVRDPHAICGTMKGNSSFCGTSTDACVDPSMDMANGTTYQEGPYCALRSECRPRKQCAPCTTDLDCSSIPGQHCTQVGPEKVCTRDCNVDSDCDNTYSCPAGACIPRFGACVGTGNFCEPCRTDLDCGGKDSKLGCTHPGSGSESICFDSSLSASCTTDADCPTSPGGLHGTCLNENQGVAQGDPQYHKCYLPFIATTDRYTCWKGGTGSACVAAKECVSNKCVGQVCK
jgi:hypothetical protein